jgi:hypothetical protein
VVRTLVMLDTDHIKSYVFGTNRLREIRGASSLLDRLNRKGMERVAGWSEFKSYQLECIYANGGSGLFLMEADEAVARKYASGVQRIYRLWTGGGASLSYAVQPLPEDIPGDMIKDYDIKDYIDLLNYRLQMQKQQTPMRISSPTHVLMRPCEACGLEYATRKWSSERDQADQSGGGTSEEAEVIAFDDEENGSSDLALEDGESEFYCESCWAKREEDLRIKGHLKKLIPEPLAEKKYLWDHLIAQLRKIGYEIPDGTERPDDFNVFQDFAGVKGYLGLIYADGNGMGKRVRQQRTLTKLKRFAETVDDSVFEAMASAVKQHLPVVTLPKRGEEEKKLFPFDILLIGGDDIVVVTPATKAMDVALTIAQEFYKITEKKNREYAAAGRKESGQQQQEKPEGYTLSLSVVMAPTKYPFGLLWQLAGDALKFAKKFSLQDETRINFLSVTGSTVQRFEKHYATIYTQKYTYEDGSIEQFYGTLRPYTIEQLSILLAAIRKGHRVRLGRTKLHQLREAILKRSLGASVGEALATLRNWKDEQKKVILDDVYQMGIHAQKQRRVENDLNSA